MKFFGRSAGFVFRIEKSVPGTYLNSPRVWRPCGRIRAESRKAALQDAAYKVGSSLVRVIPESPEDGGRP